MFSRNIPVKDFPIKVWAWSTYDREEIDTVVRTRFESDFIFPLLPNPSCIDLELHEDIFNQEGWYNDSLIQTWDQALEFLRHHIKGNKPFWIMINEIEVDQIELGFSKVPRLLIPKFRYNISIESFSFMEFKNSNFIKNLCRI